MGGAEGGPGGTRGGRAEGLEDPSVSAGGVRSLDLTICWVSWRCTGPLGPAMRSLRGLQAGLNGMPSFLLAEKG